MHRPLIAALLPGLLLALLPLLGVGCSPERPPEEGAGQARVELPPLQPKQGDELRGLVELAEVIAVGEVTVLWEEEGVEEYEVVVREILLDRAALAVETHPRQPQGQIRVQAQCYRPGQPIAPIRRLEELNRYLFFLAPAEEAGEWLVVEEPQPYVLPAQRKVREEVEALIAESR